MSNLQQMRIFVQELYCKKVPLCALFISGKRLFHLKKYFRNGFYCVAFIIPCEFFMKKYHLTGSRQNILSRLRGISFLI